MIRKDYINKRFHLDMVPHDLRTRLIFRRHFYSFRVANGTIFIIVLTYNM